MNEKNVKMDEVGGSGDWVTLLKDNTRTGGLGAAALENPGRPAGRPA